ncbi:MAG TPA: hypothetical protein VKD43_06675 [Xanthobacteraceae bacterium]|nr:hypothetical protein [Xanthobacteraceae bacterium]
MPSIVMIVLVLLALGGTGTAAGAAAADACKQCRDQQRACMSNYAGDLQDRVRPLHEVVPAKVARPIR